MQVHCAVIDLTVINRDFVDLLLLQFIQWLLELTQSIMSDFVVKHQLDAASCGIVSVGGGGGGGGEVDFRRARRSIVSLVSMLGAAASSPPNRFVSISGKAKVEPSGARPCRSVPPAIHPVAIGADP
mmetsp:Transcript_68132/g.118558  ORF Transcript_68132/g.118558 Transcript_68132/m.118558 type:complete len:127 (+) Transcript_68132:143-523(+)